MNQLDIGEFDIDGISVGIGISEEVIAARFPSEGVAAAVYLEVAAAGLCMCGCYYYLLRVS